MGQKWTMYHFAWFVNVSKVKKQQNKIIRSQKSQEKTNYCSKIKTLMFTAHVVQFINVSNFISVIENYKLRPIIYSFL